MQSTIRCDPHTAISLGPEDAINTIEAAADFRPVPSVKLPELIAGGAPDSSVGHFQEGHGSIRAALICRLKNLPLFLVIAGGAMLSAYPEGAIVRFEKGGKTDAN